MNNSRLRNSEKILNLSVAWARACLVVKTVICESLGPANRKFQLLRSCPGLAHNPLVAIDSSMCSLLVLEMICI